MCCVRSAASEKLCMRRQIVVRSNACTSARRPVKKMTFTTEAGSNPATRFPKSGPHDERLGYVGLPSFIDRLSARGFLIEWQERDRLRSWTSWRRAVTMFARPRAILRRRPLASFVRESARAPAEHARHRKIEAASDNDLALLRGVIGTSRETNRRRNGGGTPLRSERLLCRRTRILQGMFLADGCCARWIWPLEVPRRDAPEAGVRPSRLRPLDSNHLSESVTR